MDNGSPRVMVVFADQCRFVLGWPNGDARLLSS